MDYYVDSVDGSDSNPGTLEYPWRTLAPVHAHGFLPGDVVHFKRDSVWTGESIHWKGALVINDSGAEGNPITFTTYGDGDRPVIRNPGSPDNWTRAVVIKADWVILEGFLIRDAWRNGVHIDGGKHNVVQDVEITDAGTGIRVYGQHNLLTRNYIHDLHMIKNTPDVMHDDFGAEGIKFYRGHNEASYNTLVNCTAPSHDYGTDGGAFALLTNTDGNYIHHNQAINCDGFLEVAMGSARDTIVAYNVAVDCRRFSLLSLPGSGCPSEVENFRIENNTIVQTKACNYIFHFAGDPPGPDTFLVRNNIVHAHDVWHVAKYDTFTHDHNLYYLSGSSALNMNLHEGEQITDPFFVDLAGGDFHLQPGSPAIGAGVWLGHTFDFDDRPVIDPPDLGAYQYWEVAMNIVEMLRLKATELRVMADEIDAAANTLAAIDVTADATVAEVQEALEAAQAVAEAL